MSDSTHAIFSRHQELGKWYDPVQLNCETILRRARRESSIRTVAEILGKLEPDDYSVYLSAYLAEGLRKFGEDWDYFDITNTLLAASSLAKPRNYLEIGVRRGRSLSMVATSTPEVNILGFDLWVENYAGMGNPGPDFVASELKKIGHRGTLKLIGGDSHKTVPQYFRENPSAEFDLITVDGDHSDAGALDDLHNVLPHLAVGGVLVFDDVSHPAHPNLLKVWKRAVETASFRLRSFEYTSLGYGIALAIRQS